MGKDSNKDGATASSRPVYPKRDRLPTLQEVLSRSTRPPVDLYCYYLFLQREGAADMLDFWLDVHQHENLVRAYFKDLQLHGRSVREEWPRYYEVAKKRGSLWNGLNGVTQDAVDEEEEEEHHEQDDPGDDDHSVNINNSSSSMGRGESDEKAELGAKQQRRRRDTLGVDDEMDAAERARWLQRTPSPTSNGPRPNFSANFSPTLKALYPHDRELHTPSPAGGLSSVAMSSNNPTHSSARSGRLSLSGISSVRAKNSSTLPYIQRDSAITRTDLIASAERIYTMYLQPNAIREIYLPNVLRIDDFPIASGQLPHTYSEPKYDVESETLARVPDMFHSQKEWCFRAMEQDSFPRFLRSKAFGNLTPISAMIRLVAGLFLLWVGLSTALSFIFLNYLPKAKRLWVSGNPLRGSVDRYDDSLLSLFCRTQVILPFSIASLFLLSYAYDLDPFMVFWGVSETVRKQAQCLCGSELGPADPMTPIVAVSVPRLHSERSESKNPTSRNSC